MGRTRRTFRPKRAQIKLALDGRDLKPVQEKRAIKRAQKKSSRQVLELVRQKAQAKMNVTRHEPKRDHPAPMIAYYRTNIRQDLAIVLTNPTIRGRAFEVGAKAHPIVARRVNFLKFRASPNVPFTYTRRVNMHPGQQGRFPMAESMEQMAPTMAENLAESIEQEFAR